MGWWLLYTWWAKRMNTIYIAESVLFCYLNLFHHVFQSKLLLMQENRSERREVSQLTCLLIIIALD